VRGELFAVRGELPVNLLIYQSLIFKKIIGKRGYQADIFQEKWTNRENFKKIKKKLNCLSVLFCRVTNWIFSKWNK
jgi:hypothetical protein